MEGKRCPRPDENHQISKTVSDPNLNNKQCNVNFDVLYTNADSLCNKRDELQILLSSFPCKSCLIVITEVNAKNSQTAILETEININGYNIFGCNVGSPSHRGIAVYVRNDICASEVIVDSLFSEYIFIQVLVGKRPVMTVGAIYRSRSSSLSNDDNLYKLISYMNSNFPGRLLLIGDFNFPNIDWSNWSSQSTIISSGNKFVLCLRKNLLMQHIFSPTRFRGSQTPHILDLVVTNNDLTSEVFYLPFSEK